MFHWGVLFDGMQIGTELTLLPTENRTEFCDLVKPVYAPAIDWCLTHFKSINFLFVIWSLLIGYLYLYLDSYWFKLMIYTPISRSCSSVVGAGLLKFVR